MFSVIIMSEVLDRQTIKALSTDARQDIMKLLAKRPHTATEIAKLKGKHVTTITEHLDTLEKSGLVRKKDGTNKWVYYILTEKGEHLFKPQFYSWVVVFSLSIVLMFVGVLRLFRFDSSMETAGASMSLAKDAAPVVYIAPVDYIAYALVVIGIAGLSYIGYRKFLQK